MAGDMKPPSPPIALQEPSPPDMSNLQDIKALQAKVVDLTKENTVLELRVIAADAKVKAATDRAQTRYTASLHSNRQVERLEKELANEKWQRKDNAIKAVKCYNGLKAQIAHLKDEKENNEQAGVDTTQGHNAHVCAVNQTLQDEVLRVRGELAQAQTSSANTIRNLGETITKLQTSIAAEQAKVKSNFDAAETEQFRKKLAADLATKAAESLAKEKSAIQDQLNSQFDAWIQKKSEEMHTIHKQEEKERSKSISAGEAKCKELVLAANQQVQWYKQQLMNQTAQRMPQRGISKHAVTPMTPEPGPGYGLQGNANKRRRLNSGGNFGMTTPDFQKGHLYSHGINNPYDSSSSSFDKNNGIEMNGGSMHIPTVYGAQQGHGQQPLVQSMMQGAPNVAAQRQLSQQSNISIGQDMAATPNVLHQRTLSQQSNDIMTPTGQSQQQHASSFMHSPHQQQLDSAERARLMKAYRQQNGPHGHRATKMGTQSNGQISPAQYQTLFHDRLDGFQHSDTVVNARQLQQQQRQFAQRQMMVHAQNAPMMQQQHGGTTAVMPMQQPNAPDCHQPLSMNVHVPAQQHQQNIAPPDNTNFLASQMNHVYDNSVQPTQTTGHGAQAYEHLHMPTLSAAARNKGFSVHSEDIVDDYNFESTADVQEYFPDSVETSQAAIPMMNGMQVQHDDHGNEHQQPYQYFDIAPPLMMAENTLNDGGVNLSSGTPASQAVNGSQMYSGTQQNQQPIFSRSVPASSGRTPISSRSTPAPGITPKIACVGCYSHWWEDTCDGQPCSNCVMLEVTCLRPKCANFAAGTCLKGARCRLVHEKDPLYHDEAYLVTLSDPTKPPRRIGRKVDAEAAPSARANLNPA